MPYRRRSKVFQGKPALFSSARIMADSYTDLVLRGKRLFKDVFKTHHLSATLTPVSKTGASRESKTT